MMDYLTKLYELGALPVVRPGATQKIAVGATSAQSAAVETHVVRVVATTDCHIAFGEDPVADGGGLMVAAMVPEYFACHEAEKIAVVREGADGWLYITAAAG